MQVIDAVWEKRNLGVSTSEIMIDIKDDLYEVKRFLSEFEDEYIVLKVPSVRADITNMASLYRFVFIEDMVTLSSNLQEIRRNPLQKRLYDSVQVEKMKKEDMDELLDEVGKGMFDADRISLDPFFSSEQAGIRYVNWIQDELDKQTEFLKYVYKGEMAGFLSIREIDGGNYTAPLGGFYRKSRNTGLGTVVKVPEEVKKRGGRSVRTGVSSNNPAQLRNLVVNGYVPEGISHIFIKHC